jgi:hypothetical protein
VTGRHGGPRKNAGAPPRPSHLELCWAPSRKVPIACRNGHKFTQKNTIYSKTREKVYRRCRACRNDYHRERGRDIYFEQRIRRALADAIALLRMVAAKPKTAAPEVLAAAAGLGEQLRKAWRRPIDFSSAIRNPYAKRLHAAK